MAAFYYIARWAVDISVGALGALVFQDCWTWFAVPLGAPAIGYFHAWGIAITVKMLGAHLGDADMAATLSQRQQWTRTVTWAVYYLIVWGLAALISTGV